MTRTLGQHLLDGAREARVKTRLLAFYTPEEADQWIALPHPQLDGLTASEAIREGRYSDVIAIINRLETGAFV